MEPMLSAPWLWGSLALLLLLAEVLGAGGFLLGAAAAAGITGVVAALISPGWQWQGALFGVLAVILTVAYLKGFRRFNERSDQPLLNQRMQRWVGHTWTLAEALPVGESRLQLGDSLWRVQTSTALAAGIRVQVSRVEGSVLMVEAA